MTATPASPALPASSRGRLLIWAGLAVWALVAAELGQHLARDMRFRVNDLSVIPGAGLISRDPSGVFYHVNNEGKARAIYPTLAPPVYQYDCLDCALVTGEQMSATNDFCASGREAELPDLQFEIPCRTWAPIGEGAKVMGFAVWFAPVGLYGLLRLVQSRRRRRR